MQSYIVYRSKRKKRKVVRPLCPNQLFFPKPQIYSNHILMHLAHSHHPVSLTKGHSRLFWNIDDNFLETLHISDSV